LFESDSVASLVQQIGLIYENPDMADQFSNAASRFVLRFDIQQMRQSYFQLYQSLIVSKNYSESTLGEVLNGTSI
jgi:hypothetical protein